MIHHLSLPAADPRHVADALARLLGGPVTPFGPLEGSWTAWAGDAHGTAVEVYPRGTQLVPPDAPIEAAFHHDPSTSPFVATHAAISVDRTPDEVFAFADELGWRALRLPRGGFDVIELWIENAVMIEVLTPEMAADYLSIVPGSTP